MILALLSVAAFPEAMAEEPVAAKSSIAPGPAQSLVSSPSTHTPAPSSAPSLPPVVLPQAPDTGISPLRNIDLLNKMEDERLPTSPRHFLKVRFKQVRRAKDQKILQLLLVCVGFVGAFVAILALRSVPPNRPQSS